MKITLAPHEPVDVALDDLGHGRPYLLLHGGAGPRSVAAFAGLLAGAGDARVLVPTHPGFDGTARPDWLASPAGLAELYAEVVSAEARTRRSVQRAELRDMADEAVAVVFGAGFPAIFFLLAALGLIERQLAFSLSKWSGLGLICGYGFVAAVAMWHKARGGVGSPAVEPPQACPPLRIARDFAAGLMIGAMTGFFGVGGGFLIVPTLALALALSMRLAVGTSLAIITATSVMALGAHLVAGRSLDPPVTLTMATACVLGALAGVRLAGRVRQRQLGEGFAVLVVVVATYLLVSAAFLGGPPGS